VSWVNKSFSRDEMLFCPETKLDVTNHESFFIAIIFGRKGFHFKRDGKILYLRRSNFDTQIYVN
jgi:hypothetical protein